MTADEELPGAACINGEFYARHHASISVMDSGFMLGMNVVDTLHAFDGYVFRITDHLERFYRSAHAVRIPLHYTIDEFRDMTLETVRRSGLRDALIMLFATRGIRTIAPIDEWDPTTIILAIPYVANNLTAESIRRGIRVRTTATRHLSAAGLDPDIKTPNRLHYYLAFLEAADAGADDALLLDSGGAVTESRACNVFVVRYDMLETPASGILRGITRRTVLEIAAQESIRAAERQLTRYDLYCADEVFFTSTAGGIIPVVEVDGRRVGTGEPGPITKRIDSVYWAMHVGPPYGTPVPATIQQSRHSFNETGRRNR